MSSYTTTARSTPNTSCDLETAYVADPFFPTYAMQHQNHSQQQQQQQQHQDLCNNEKISMTQSDFDCFPQAVASIPMENLSLNQSMSSDWPLELGGEYQSDINFLFTCNELGVTTSESSSASSLAAAATTTTTESEASISVDHFRQQQYSIKEAEQFRRFSLEETDTLSNLLPLYQSPMYNSSKERSSMPNVFEQFTTSIPTQQQGRLSWQQSTLLQKRPDHQPQNVVSSISSPLKKHTKKRSLVDQVLNEEYMPSVVSSLSEPIPTISQQWMIRKRNKSARQNNANKSNEHVVTSSAASPTTPTTTAAVTGLFETPEYIVPSSLPMDSDDIQQQHPHQHYDYIVPSDPNLHYEDMGASATTSDSNNSINANSNSNQLLAAMPRRQKLRYDGDNYTPKWVRFTGHLKEGYCDSCQPGKWLQLKNSAYWYHKQFYHGISSVSGKPFMKPLEQRMGKGDMIEGLCHQCHRFVSACNGKKKNNYMLWYRHAHKCHLYDKPKVTTSKSVRKLSNDTSNATPTDTATIVSSSSPSTPPPPTSSSSIFHQQHHY